MKACDDLLPAVPETHELARELPSAVLYGFERAGEISREILDERVREWAANGWTQQDIADELGCSRQAIAKRMVRLGIEPTQPHRKRTSSNPVATSKDEGTRRRLSDEDRRRILVLHAEGNNQKQIAEATGWSQKTVSIVVRAKSPSDRLPRRRTAGTAQTRAVAKVQGVCREWDALGDEDYIPAPEIARRIRVLDQALTFLTRKRAHYYEMERRP